MNIPVDRFEQWQTRATTLRTAVSSGRINTASRAILTEYSEWLCDPLASQSLGDREHQQISELVRLHMLRNFMDEAEKRGNRIQNIVVVLTILAIVGTIVQTWYSYKADKRAENELTISTRQYDAAQSSTSVSSQTQPQTRTKAASQASSISSIAAPASSKNTR